MSKKLIFLLLVNQSFFIYSFGNNVRISIKCPVGLSTPVSISCFESIGTITILDSTSTNSISGIGQLEFQILRPTFVMLKIDVQYVSMFIESEYDLKVIQADDKSITYSGNGSNSNNYLAGISKITYNFFQNDYTKFKDLIENEFLNKVDSLDSSFTSFHKHFTDSITLNPKIASLFQLRNFSQRLQIKQIYSDKFLTKDAGFKVPKHLNINKEIPIDSVLLKSCCFEYLILFNLFLETDFIDSSKIGDLRFIEEQRDILPILTQTEILKRKYPTYFEEFLLAGNISKWMYASGLTIKLDSLYSVFSDKFPNSDYTKPLQKQRDKWISISFGKPAPEITGTTIQGDTFSLKDLKGKIVYVDVWATWCGPCIAQFPFSKKLHAKYKNNDKVVFLYVSVDKNLDSWKKKVFKEKLKGIHIVNKGSINKDFNITGIPRYILIDQNGSIADSEAARPASGKVESQIEELLGN